MLSRVQMSDQVGAQSSDSFAAAQCRRSELRPPPQGSPWGAIKRVFSTLSKAATASSGQRIRGF